MKKLRLPVLFVTIVVIMAVVIPGCKKIIKNIFQGVDSDIPAFTVVLPPIPFVPPTETSLGSYDKAFNLDSTMKASTGGVYGASDVSSIKVKEISLKVLNADTLNNAANFESARFTFSSDTKREPVQVAAYTFPDSYSDSAIIPANSSELKPYLTGSLLTYNVFGKLRRVTTKGLMITISVTLRIQ